MCGGLLAAANFAALFGQETRATRYRAAAEAVRVGMATYLYVPEAKRFARQRTESGLDLTVDASLYGACAFGAFAARHPMVRSTMAAVQQQLWVPTPLGGCARYTGDTYQCAHRGPGARESLDYLYALAGPVRDRSGDYR